MFSDWIIVGLLLIALALFIRSMWRVRSTRSRDTDDSLVVQSDETSIEAEPKVSGDAMYALHEQVLDFESTRPKPSRARDAVADATWRWVEIFKSMQDGVITTDTQGRVEWMNRVAEELTGWSWEDAQGKSVEVVFDISHPEQEKSIQNPVRDVLVTGQPIESQHFIALISRDGVRRQILTTAAPIVSQASGVEGVVMVCRDITQLYEAHQQIVERERTFYEMTNSTPLMLWMMNAEHLLFFVNRATRHYLGVDDLKIPINYFDSIHEQEREHVQVSIQGMVERKTDWVQLEYRLRDASNQYRWMYSVIKVVYGEDQAIRHYIGSSIDITERKAVESQIERLAYYDSLTQLPNRRLLMDRLGRALSAVKREKLYGVVFYMDMDHFKKLNDSMGHSVGDQLLKLVAKRIRSTLRAEDTVARFGGDEFIVLSGQLEANERDAVLNARLLGEKIRASLAEPYQLGEIEYHSTPSIGMTLFSHTNNRVDDVIMQADTAMYRAKTEGRNQVCFYEPHMQDAIVQQVEMERQLREALKNRSFRLYYQPQVDMDGQIIGAEALLRWPQPDGQMISPKHFLAVAEETGQMIAIGYWVLETACAQLKQWESAGLPDRFTLSINISHRQFIQQDFAKQFKNIIEKSGVDSARLQLEVTEYVVRDSIEVSLEKMNALKLSTQVKFSLDDFGTGYSSLTYLRKFPLDEIKIDRKFIRDLMTDENDALLTETILEIGNKMGVNVVAEGVETSEQSDFLQQHGCVRVQGFLFGRPIPATQFFDAYLSGNSPVTSGT